MHWQGKSCRSHLLRGLPHLNGVAQADCRRLLAGDVRSRLQRRYRPLLVEHIRRTDRDEVGRDLVEHFLQVGVVFRYSVTFGGAFCRLETYVGDGGELDQPLALEYMQRGQVRAVRNHSTADNRCAQFFHMSYLS